MAVVHKKGSPLFDQAINYGLGGAACLATSFFMVYSGYDVLHIIGIAIFLFSGYFFSQCSRRCSGSWGEHEALSGLSKELPDQYHLFVNVSVHEKMESDMVVIGPNGVFIVEVKSFNGTLEGSVNDRNWVLHKVGRKGGRYTKTIKNPLRQLKRNIAILSQYLKLERCSAWIDGVVLFPNDNTEWCDGVPDKCFEASRDVAQHIVSYEPRRPLSEHLIGKLIASLEKCQEGSAMTLNEFKDKTETIQKKFA